MIATKPAAIILSGGRGTRLKGIAAPFSKTFLRVNGLPVIAYAVRAVVPFVSRIILVAHPSTADEVMAAAREGCGELDLNLELALQTEPRGMADAMRVGFAAVADDCSAVVLAGDNITLDPRNVGQVLGCVTAHTGPCQTAGLAWTFRELEPPEANRFSVYLPLDESRGQLIEKPQEPPSNICWCGPVAFRSAATALARCQELTPSARGEYEATDLMNSYLRAGQGRSFRLAGPWFDIGTPDALREAEKVIAGLAPPQ